MILQLKIHVEAQQMFVDWPKKSTLSCLSSLFPCPNEKYQDCSRFPLTSFLSFMQVKKRRQVFPTPQREALEHARMSGSRAVALKCEF